jgi:hypothetical protein
LTAETPNTPGSARVRPTPDEVIAQSRLYFAIIVIAGIFVCFVGIGVLALMIVPLAHVIAGKHTEFTFTFTLSLSVAFAMSTAVAGGGWALQTSRAKRYKNRTKELETKLAAMSKNQSRDAGQISK